MCLVSWKSVGADVCEKAVGTETASQLLPSQALQTSWVSCCIRSNSPWWTSLPLSGFDGFPSTCMCSRLIYKVSVCSLKVQQQLKCQTQSGLISFALPASSRLAQRNLFQKCLFFFFLILWDVLHSFINWSIFIQCLINIQLETVHFLVCIYACLLLIIINFSIMRKN